MTPPVNSYSLNCSTPSEGFTLTSGPPEPVTVPSSLKNLKSSSSKVLASSVLKVLKRTLMSAVLSLFASKRTLRDVAGFCSAHVWSNKLHHDHHPLDQLVDHKWLLDKHLSDESI